jgi:nucleoside-diphosphate-sugar epimerase
VFFLYGPGEHPARLVASVIERLLRGERAAVTHGTQVRDFLHVADVAGAFAALVSREEVQGAVNIASGVPVSLRELLVVLENRLGAHGLIGFGERPAPVDEPPVIVADVERLRDEAGFVPKLSLESGLDDAIAHLRKRL